MPDTNAHENLDAEGTSEIEDRAPGMDVELDEESTMAPRDYPIAAGDDPAYPVTAAEERRRESVAERAARESPDGGADPPGEAVDEWGEALDHAGDPVEDAGGGSYVLGALGNAVSPDKVREQAIDADPLPPPAEKDSVANEPEVPLLGSNAEEGLDADDVPEAVTDAGDGVPTDAEEVAVHVRRDG
jgi:hypothetical protein